MESEAAYRRSLYAQPIVAQRPSPAYLPPRPTPPLRTSDLTLGERPTDASWERHRQREPVRLTTRQPPPVPQKVREPDDFMYRYSGFIVLAAIVIIFLVFIAET